ncbi:hypothetical protein BDV97DRAFT_398467 [Delphinella strobiligena]|nr:hypothetical protein BDV97DRAFT_398467 [Delphinella strobiligena]
MTRLVVKSSSLTPECKPPQNLDMFPLGKCRLGIGTDDVASESTYNTSGAPKTASLRARGPRPDLHELPVQYDDAPSGTKCRLEHRVVSAAFEHLPVGSEKISGNSRQYMIQVTCAGWQCFRAVVLQREEADGYSETEYLNDDMPATPTSTFKHLIVPKSSVLHGGKRRRTTSDSDSPISKKPRLSHSTLPAIRRPKIATGHQHGSNDRNEDSDEKDPLDANEKIRFKFEKWDGPRSYPLKDETFRHFEKARYYSSYTLSHGKPPQDVIPYTQEENEYIVDLIRKNLKNKDLCDHFNQRFANKLFRGSVRPERSADAIGKNIARRGLRTQAGLPIRSKHLLPGYQKQGSPQQQ